MRPDGSVAEVLFPKVSWNHAELVTPDEGKELAANLLAATILLAHEDATRLATTA